MYYSESKSIVREGFNYPIQYSDEVQDFWNEEIAIVLPSKNKKGDTQLSPDTIIPMKKRENLGSEFRNSLKIDYDKELER